MLHVSITCHRRAALTRCALESLDRTLNRFYRPWIITNEHPLLHGETFSRDQLGSYADGRKRDVTLAALPADAEWFFCMHNDSAPLRAGWFDWLVERIGDGVAGGFLDSWGTGLPHPSGALYRVPWLRDTHASFVPRPGFDVGQGLTRPVAGDTFIASQATARPWWMKNLDVAEDDTGRLLYAHMGGGTIGATARRFPWWAWPYFVRRELGRIKR